MFQVTQMLKYFKDSLLLKVEYMLLDLRLKKEVADMEIWRFLFIKVKQKRTL